MKYTMLGDHVRDLASGQMLGPGESVDLDNDALADPHNKVLIDEGILVPGEEESAADDSESKSKTTSKKT